MSGSSGTLVWWILVPLFAAVGLYLIWYSRRRKRMLEAFAKAHQFSIRPGYTEKLQEALDSCFSLNQEGLVRSFDRLSSLIDAGSVWLFRAVELLDLNPHAQSSSAHFTRIAALFDVPVGHDEFFLLDKSMRASQRLHGSEGIDPRVLEITKKAAASCNARHTLSVTLAHGHGLIYFEPLVTGGEKIDDVTVLCAIATDIHEELSRPGKTV